MAEQREQVDVNRGENNVQNMNYNHPDYSNYQQYWQYYYSYYMYYYNFYYYMLLCQNNAGFIGNVPQQQSLHQQHGTVPTAQLNGARVQPNNEPNLGRRFFNGGLFGVFAVERRREPEERYEYRVAPLGKRVFAEFIDFVFLYFIKYSLFLLYYKDPDKLNTQFQYILVIDDNTSIKDLEDVLFQALIYRFIVFLYEALFIAMPFPCTIGGATLGKYMMGITVVQYLSFTPIEGHNLRRFTGYASRLSLWQSCVRATLKNFMITFFFPIIFTTMFLQNFRTPYDFVASSVVVDAYPRRLNQRQN
ncbi:protein FAM8A1-like [Dendronephthya gigantea]|uniref:protein FAM8A1-like n=1 Tax=Dendronephthya gigantea TaxID=151771 RepID=UPI00106D8C77|nr:protein FAM8A1-like [Dendronephthya gigantea]